MTCREKLKMEHPNKANSCFAGGCDGCPSVYGYLDDPDYCMDGKYGNREKRCTDCWDREISEKKDETAMKKEIHNESLERKAADIVSCYHALVEGGFSKERAFDIIIALLKGE